MSGDDMDQGSVRTQSMALRGGGRRVSTRGGNGSSRQTGAKGAPKRTSRPAKQTSTAHSTTVAKPKSAAPKKGVVSRGRVLATRNSAAKTQRSVSKGAKTTTAPRGTRKTLAKTTRGIARPAASATRPRATTRDASATSHDRAGRRAGAVGKRGVPVTTSQKTASVARARVAAKRATATVTRKAMERPIAAPAAARTPAAAKRSGSVRRTASSSAKQASRLRVVRTKGHQTIPAASNRSATRTAKGSAVSRVTPSVARKRVEAVARSKRVAAMSPGITARATLNGAATTSRSRKPQSNRKAKVAAVISTSRSPRRATRVRRPVDKLDAQPGMETSSSAVPAPSDKPIDGP